MGLRTSETSEVGLARLMIAVGIVALLIAFSLARGAEPQAATTGHDPSKVEIVLPVASGWQARLIHKSDVGVWTVGSLKAFPLNGCPEVFALDDKGRCRILSCYSQRWTTWNTIEDSEWLGAFAEVDLDPKRSGVEMYTGGKRGNLYRIVAHDGAFDTALIARYSGEELHTAVGGDLCRARPGNELLVFTHLGNVYDVRRDDAADSGYTGKRHAVLPGRVRQALVLPTRGDTDPEIAAVLRSGEILLLRMTLEGIESREILNEPMGFGRLAIRESGLSDPLVLYATRDDGVVIRLERGADGAFARELIFAGPQGPRGIAAGRFDADPAVETVAVFGYSARVQLLSRKPGEPWNAQTIYEDADRGHWLHAMEIDGRNGTTELIGSGYSGNVFLLSREPGYGLDGVPVDPGPVVPPVLPPAPEKPRSTSELPRAEPGTPRLAVVSRAASIADLLPFGYRGGFETKTLLFDTLVRADAKGTIRPGLATNWRIEADGRRFVFTLREGATFADGSPLDAESVRLHLERVAGLPEHAWITSAARITDVVALSPRELRIDLERPTALLHDLCAINPFSITAPACHSREGERVAAIGAGPYRLDAFGESPWKLTRTSNADAALAPVVDLVPFPRPDARDFLAAFRAGTIDAFADGAYEVVPRESLDSLRSIPGVRVHDFPGGTLVYLSFRGSGPAADSALRAAVAGSIDREAIVASMFGAADPIASFSGTEVPTSRIRTPTYTAPLRLLVKEGSTDSDIARIVVASLSKAGIPTVLREETTTKHDAALASGDFDLRVERTWGVPYDPHLTLLNRFLPPPKVPSAATSRAVDADPEVTKLVARLADAAYPDEHAKILGEVHRAIDERRVFVPLVAPRRVAVERTGVLRVALDGDTYRVLPLSP
jgi:nickel transport system substrate-binding protein